MDNLYRMTFKKRKKQFVISFYWWGACVPDDCRFATMLEF